MVFLLSYYEMSAWIPNGSGAQAQRQQNWENTC